MKVLTSTYGVERPQDEGVVLRCLQLNGFPGHRWPRIWELAAIELGNIRTLGRIFNRFQPDLLFFWNMRGVSRSLLIRAQRFHVPLVFDVSDESLLNIVQGRDPWILWWTSHHNRLRSRVLRQILVAAGFRRILKEFLPVDPRPIQLNHAYFTSSYLRTHYERQGLGHPESRVIYCGINLQSHPKRIQSSRSFPFRLLYVGRVVPEKGVETAILALSILIGRRGPGSVRLTVVGPGDSSYFQQLFKLVEEGGVRAHVDFTGPLPREKVVERYHSYDVLVFPSIWEEPFALTPLEAMACGLPVIGTLTGGTKELLVDGINSLTFQAGNPIDLADRIENLMDDPELSVRVSREGSGLVFHRYSAEKMVDEIEAYLEEVIRTSKGADAAPSRTAIGWRASRSNII